jgi:hypothetical protein
MSLKDRIKEKQAAKLPESKPVDLPNLGETVVFRCLRAGALLRANAMGPDIQSLAIIAMGTEDPEKPGVPLWDWGDIVDRGVLENLHPEDFKALIAAHNDLSGEGETDAANLGKSEMQGSGSISCPPVSESPPASSGSESTPGSTEH